jgi:hypothetical protein
MLMPGRLRMDFAASAVDADCAGAIFVVGNAGFALVVGVDVDAVGVLPPTAFCAGPMPGRSGSVAARAAGASANAIAATAKTVRNLMSAP